MIYSDRQKINCMIAEKVFGMSWVCVSEECSQFTPHAYWEPGSECYYFDVYYAASQDVITRIQNDESFDASAFLMPDYVEQLRSALQGVCERGATDCSVAPQTREIVAALHRIVMASYTPDEATPLHETLLPILRAAMGEPE